MSIPSFLVGSAVGVLAAAASFTPEGRAFAAKLAQTVKDDLDKATSATTTAAPGSDADAKDEHHAPSAQN